MLSPRWRWRLEQWRRRAETLFARRASQPKPRLCPACGLLVGSQAKTCSYCGASMSALSFTGLRRIATAILPAETPITYALLFANLVFFAVAWVISQRTGGTRGVMDVNTEVLFLLGAKHAARILILHEYWRLVMPIFLHAGLIHLAFNSFVLWQVGPQVEELFGSARFLFLYLATGVAGFIASAWWYHPAALSVGSSGSIFGLIGVLIGYISQAPGFASQYRASLIRWAVYAFIIGVFLGADNAAHLGGLLSGLVLGRVVSERRPVTAAQRLTVTLMGWGSAAVILLSVALTMLHLRPVG
ncbi:MAG: rhomboid family intramembrane serine protease [Acidobacteria bacterium]|nr:rhomboid family intramembrane serine protease [Acidobacteriota bacterium]